jgi:dienelactone hydrolase
MVVIACLLLLWSVRSYSTDVSFEEIKIPTVEKGLFGAKPVMLSVKVFRPKEDGRYPLVLIIHGRPCDSYDARTFTALYKKQSAFFVSMGFIVANPLRRGYGSSDGVIADSSGRCASPSYYDAAIENIKDIKEVIEYMKQQSYVDPGRIILAGQSVGGFSAVAYGSKYPQDLLVVINFAGGDGSIKPGEVCRPDILIDTFSDFGKNATVPNLWIYAEDDSYFGPDLVRKMHKADTDAGGKAKLIFGPPGKGYDHKFFYRGIEVWKLWLIPFLDEPKLMPADKKI